jgi:hypothetical protein
LLLSKWESQNYNILLFRFTGRKRCFIKNISSSRSLGVEVHETTWSASHPKLPTRGQLLADILAATSLTTIILHTFQRHTCQASSANLKEPDPPEHESCKHAN